MNRNYASSYNPVAHQTKYNHLITSPGMPGGNSPFTEDRTPLGRGRG